MKRVLLVEDNENNMRLFSFILESSGFEVLTAATGRQGFELALSERPDIILLDVQLPDIEGTEVLRLIRASEIGPSIPVVAVTAYAMSGDKERFMANGYDEYIEKPIRPLVFIEQIKRILGDS